MCTTAPRSFGLLLGCVLALGVAASPARHAGDDWPPKKTPKEAGVDEKALADLVEKARAAKSDALVILVDGALVCEEYFDQPQEPIELMSCTKSGVNLLVGMLVDEKKIASVDAPVSTWFPEHVDWKSGPKKEVTVGHLLSHTSGLKCNRTTEEIYASRNFVKLALEAELADPPGTRFFYNNKAVNLLAGVIEKASGKKMDEFARERLFEPLGINEFGWTKDDAGNPHGMSGLQLHAIDFAAIGQLMVQGGEWEGERIVSEEWIAASTKPAHPELGADAGRCGWLWWLDAEPGACFFDDELLARWKKAGGSERLLAVGKELCGKRCKDVDEMRVALRAAVTKVSAKDATGGAAPDLGWFDPEVNQLGVPFWKETPGPSIGFRADGYLGNYLVVRPAKRLVAVRQRRYPKDEAELGAPKYAFGDFAQLVGKLVSRPRSK